MTRSLEDLKSSVRALDRKIEQIQMDAALLTGVLPLPEGRKLWSTTEINWDDHNIPGDMKDNYMDLLRKRYALNKQASRMEAEKDGELPRWEARELAYNWLNCLGDKGNDWLLEHNLTTVSLTEEILRNPNFLEEVI